MRIIRIHGNFIFCITVPVMTHEQARTIVRRSRRVAFFTGAGISADSGIATFRDNDGLWETYEPADFGSVQGIAKIALFHPAKLANFLHDFLSPIVNARPNAGHFAIAELATEKEVTVVTQNVDGLHQRGGSANVLQLHGSIYQSRRLMSTKTTLIELEDLQMILRRLGNLRSGGAKAISILRAFAPAAKIDLHGIWLPNLVLFGQRLPSEIWSKAVAAVEQCDCLVVVGTSLTVYPAALLVDVAKRSGRPVLRVDRTLENPVLRIDRSLENNDGVAGPASTMLPIICT